MLALREEEDVYAVCEGKLWYEREGKNVGIIALSEFLQNLFRETNS